MEKKLKRFTKIKEELGWTCDTLGNVWNKKGEKIGHDKDGYLASKIREDNKIVRVYLHQYIWFFFTGEIPLMIDHINHNKKDNRLENLRNVTQQQNQFNRSNTKGYYFVKKKWRAMIRLNGKLIHLGYFLSEEEAKEAYLKAKEKYHLYV